MSTYLDVLRYRELLGNLFRRDLQAKYRGSALGVLWTIANPVLLMGVYLLVFSVVPSTCLGKADNYPLFPLAAPSPPTFLSTSPPSRTPSMPTSAHLIRDARLPTNP